jgi:outer membrane receptor for monomeric catechols
MVLTNIWHLEEPGLCYMLIFAVSKQPPGSLLLSLDAATEAQMECLMQLKPSDSEDSLDEKHDNSEF